MSAMKYMNILRKELNKDVENIILRRRKKVRKAEKVRIRGKSKEQNGKKRNIFNKKKKKKWLNKKKFHIFSVVRYRNILREKQKDYENVILIIKKRL